jgi:hypothetical protein
MPFKGVLQRQPFNVEITGSGANGDGVALTILRITKTDQFNKVETLTAGPGAAASVDIPIGAAAARVVCSVNVPTSGGALFKLTQGATIIEENCGTDCSFVFDIAP